MYYAPPCSGISAFYFSTFSTSSILLLVDGAGAAPAALPYQKRTKIEVIIFKFK